MDETPSIGEELAMALAVQLYRKGIIDERDCAEMSNRLMAKGGDIAEDAAHLAPCIPIEAEAPSDREWSARQARSRFRLVPADGGNES